MIENTTCSGCGETVKVDLETLAIQIGGHEVEGVVLQWENDYELIGWDCPLCGYADSLEVGVED